MASRLALVAFLLMVSSAAAGARWGLRASSELAPGEAAGTSVLLGQLPGSARSGAQHILWNGALWLFGLGLAVTLSRGRSCQPAVD